MGGLRWNEQYGGRYPDLASKAKDNHADAFECWPTPRSNVVRYVVFQPLTIFLKLCEGDREKYLGKPEPEDDTDNNAAEKKRCGQGQSALTPSPVQDQHHQIE